MRANLLFILGLITISCVLSTETSFQSELNTNSEFKALFEQIKAQDNMGSVIITMAELETEGRFAALFDAIDSLSKFLVKDRAVENQQFKQATAQNVLDVARLRKARNLAKANWNSARNLLKNTLVPRRKALIALIAKQRAQLKGLKSNLRVLRSQRVAQIAVFKKQSALLIAAIASLKKALPILQGLQSGQSFAELDADLFAQVSQELKSSLSKLDMGELYNVFVESMISTLNSQNFIKQSALLEVIKLVQNLLHRLEKGLNTLDNNEALNLKRFNANQAQLVRAIKQVVGLIKANSARLVKLNARIVRVRAYKKAQWAAYQHNVNSLVVVRKAFVARTNYHNQFIREVDSEEAAIAAAVRVLAKGGVTRSS